MASCKKIVLLVIAIVSLVIVVVCFMIGGFPILINHNEIRENKKTVAINSISFSNSIVAPFETTNFNKVVLIIDYNDISMLPKSILHRRALWSADSVVLREIKHSTWVKTGGDMCSATSKITFFYNNQIIKEYGIVLEPGIVGIQSEETGWVESKQIDSLISTFSKFKPVRSVLLNI